MWIFISGLVHCVALEREFSTLLTVDVDRFVPLEEDTKKVVATWALI